MHVCDGRNGRGSELGLVVVLFEMVCRMKEVNIVPL